MGRKQRWQGRYLTQAELNISIKESVDMSPPFRKFHREVLARKVKFEDQGNVTLY
jgi:hypothetical protein